MDGGGVAGTGYSSVVFQCSFLLSIDPVVAGHAGTYRCHHREMNVVSEPVELVIAG